MRVGSGYDVHRLAKGRRLVLGGMDIPFHKGLLGWSDGDVVVHAIIDALLGAAVLGDIGTYFPSGFPRFKDISSLCLLEQTKALLKERGWRVGNIDVTIIAQEPSLAEFIGGMRERVSHSLSVDKGRVGIKAKTTDGLGVVGRGKGIAAYTVALIEESHENV